MTALDPFQMNVPGTRRPARQSSRYPQKYKQVGNISKRRISGASVPVNDRLARDPVRLVVDSRMSVSPTATPSPQRLPELTQAPARHTVSPKGLEETGVSQ